MSAEEEFRGAGWASNDPSGWSGDDPVQTHFDALREAMLQALEPVFVPPATPGEEPYNIAYERWDTLKEAFDVAGPVSGLTARAARALAEAATAAELDWKKRKSAPTLS